MRAKGAFDAEGRRKYLTREEGRRFLSQARELPPLQRLFCFTIYYTGCRISEALALGPANLDVEANAILIHTLKKREKLVVRRIPLPEFLVAELAAILPDQNQGEFWTFSRTTGWRLIKRLMATIGISGIHATTKGLRHGFGVRGALEKIPVSMIQQWMGHSDLNTTAIYLDVRDEEERQLIERTW